jgi:hypothetical protein
MQRDDGGRWVARWSHLRVALLAALLAGGVAAGAGCQQFDALPPLEEGLADQVTDFQAFNKAFLQWCVDEWKGNPDEVGP